MPENNTAKIYSEPTCAAQKTVYSQCHDTDNTAGRCEMSTATATNLSRVSHTGGTASGFQARIIDHCLTHGIEISNSKARKLSIRLARRMEAMSTEFDFFESLRILGMTTDTTARDAVRNIERNAR